jgi:hypothetical protein
MTTDLQEPRLNWLMCASASGTHRMAYWEWGDPSNDHVLMCVHGLTRTGRDFDQLAQRLSKTLPRSSPRYCRAWSLGLAD